jgi:uncharacterized membrane protein YkvI
MRRLFLCSVACAFTIIGSIIGAGFVTGKEVFVFFAKDISLGGMYFTFLCFAFAIYFVMTFMANSCVIKQVGVFVSVANLIVAGCMISALDSVYQRLFCISKNIKIFSIITAILLFIISLGGLGRVERFCSLTLPFVIVVIVILCVIKIDENSVPIAPKSYLGVTKPFVYVGFNVVLSFGVIKNSGEKLSPPFKIVASVITSFLICTCIFLLSLAVKNEGYKSEMPFLSLFYSNKKLLKIIDIITLFAIYSTLISALYTINNFGGIKINACCKLCLFLLVVLVSFVGFSAIVERLYPTIGILAYVFILSSFLLSRLFLKAQQGRTLCLPKSKE